MCGGGDGGGGGGDNDGDTGGVGWDVNKSGVLSPADGLANDPDKTDGWDTYTQADSAFGQFMGDRRSDQQVADDVAVTSAMQAGRSNFTNSRGREMAVADYSRNFAPTDTGVLGGMNRELTWGGVAGTALSAYLGGVPGFLAGRVAGYSIDQGLGNKANLSATLGGK